MVPEWKTIDTEDNDFQHIEVLRRNRTKRLQYREFFVEGVEQINAALTNGWEVVSFVYSGDRELSGWAEEILESSGAKYLLELTEPLMEKLSRKENTSELLAVLSMPESSLEAITVTRDLLAVVFDRPSNHGNLGTIIRSCDAFGADGLIVTGHAVDIYDPDVIGASLGSFFSMPVLRFESYKKLLPWFSRIQAQHHDFQVIGTSAQADRELLDHNFNKPTVLILGNETYGMSRNYRKLSDSVVTIPICGTASSLNVACAASIFLYEIDVQRRLKEADGDPGSSPESML